MTTSLLAWLLVQGLTLTSGSTDVPLAYVCPRTPAAPAIDGHLDDDVWLRAPWSASFVDIEGDIRPRPRYRTHMKMLWDDSCLYIASEMEEPHVWGTLRQRDTVIYYDNDFEVFLDPDGDHHEYFEFEMNALNTGWDLFLPKPYRDSGSAMNAWDIRGLRTGVAVQGTLNNPRDNDSGWTVEIAIPWTALAPQARMPLPPREADVWRINFSRVEWDHEVVGGWYRKIPGRPEHNWVWSPQGVVNMHKPERWGYLQFARVGSLPAFHGDSTYGARKELMEIYHAQRAYHRRTLRYAEVPGDLREDGYVPHAGSTAPRIQLTADGYSASLGARDNQGRAVTCFIRHDSRFWIVPAE